MTTFWFADYFQWPLTLHLPQQHQSAKMKPTVILKVMTSVDTYKCQTTTWIGHDIKDLRRRQVQDPLQTIHLEQVQVRIQ